MSKLIDELVVDELVQILLGKSFELNEHFTKIITSLHLGINYSDIYYWEQGIADIFSMGDDACGDSYGKVVIFKTTEGKYNIFRIIKSKENIECIGNLSLGAEIIEEVKLRFGINEFTDTSTDSRYISFDNLCKFFAIGDFQEDFGIKKNIRVKLQKEIENSTEELIKDISDAGIKSDISSELESIEKAIADKEKLPDRRRTNKVKREIEELKKKREELEKRQQDKLSSKSFKEQLREYLNSQNVSKYQKASAYIKQELDFLKFKEEDWELDSFRIDEKKTKELEEKLGRVSGKIRETFQTEIKELEQAFQGNSNFKLEDYISAKIDRSYDKPFLRQLQRLKIILHYYEFIASRNERLYYDFSDGLIENTKIYSFNEQLKVYGKRAVDVPGDGNCFFHAVEAQLRLINDGDSPFDHKQLREIAAAFVESHKSEFSDFVDGEGVDDYIERISRKGEWADNVLIQALARAIGVNIEIIQNTRPESPIRIDTSSPNTIYLGHIAELHYVSLEKSSSDTISVTSPSKRLKQLYHLLELTSADGLIENTKIYSFNEQLKVYGKRAVDVPGDGNCFFHAVEAQLRLINDGDSPFDHKQLREIAAAFVESHKSEFSDFVDGEGVDDYIERISRKGEWADNVLIQALARAIGVNIEIIQNTHPESPIRIDTSSPNTIYLGHIAELHYVSLEKSTSYIAPRILAKGKKIRLEQSQSSYSFQLQEAKLHEEDVRDIDQILEEIYYNAEEEVIDKPQSKLQAREKEAIKTRYERILSIYRNQFESVSKEESKDKILAWSKTQKLEKLGDDDEYIDEAIAYMDRANEILTGYRLRIPQIVATMIYFNTKGNKGRLLQISTGEGKTIVTSLMATIKALQGHKVDIITSNKVLAEDGVKKRKDFYKLFSLEASHNISDDHKGSFTKKECYNDDIVYGDIASFQFDYLRHKEGENILGDRKIEKNWAILDEVDSMIIDNGSHIAKIASPFPGMESLKYIYIDIWEKLHTNIRNFNGISQKLLEEKQQMLENLYAEENQKYSLTEETLKTVVIDYLKKKYNEEAFDVDTYILRIAREQSDTSYRDLLEVLAKKINANIVLIRNQDTEHPIKVTVEDAANTLYLGEVLDERTLERYFVNIVDKKESIIDEFNQTLANHNISYYAVDVPGDGNCFFHAVAAQLKLINDGDSPFNHKQLRVIAADYVESHKSELRDFVDGEGIDDYIERISRKGEWADNVLIQALARAIGVNIEIIQNTHPESPIRIDTLSPNTIYLGHIAELHYVSLNRIEDENPALEAFNQSLREDYKQIQIVDGRAIHYSSIFEAISRQLPFLQGHIHDKYSIIYQHYINEEHFKCVCLNGIEEEIRRKLETEGYQAVIPYHLKKAYVDRKLRQWIENAYIAEFIYTKDRQYKVDSKNGIVPIDYQNTGVTLGNTVWPDGLHQFLQIKHDISISTETMTSSFISNLSYIRKYKNIFGLTGTLGSNAEDSLVRFVYDLERSMVIPTYKDKQFIDYGISIEEDDEWLDEIVNRAIEVAEERAVLIICETVATLKEVESSLKEIILNKSRVIRYESEKDKSNISGKISVGKIIVSTNIGARGTDLELNEELKNNGGLHVIVGFLPYNQRVEDQAFGRAARQGDPGSAELIVSQSNLKSYGLALDSTIKQVKEKRDGHEKLRLEKIKNKKIKELQYLDQLFERFIELYSEVRERYQKQQNYYAIKDLKEIWAHWLEENNYQGQADLIEVSEDFIERKFNEFRQLVNTQVENGKISFNPFYALAQADEFIEKASVYDTSPLTKAMELTDEALRIGNDSALLYSAHIKKFEIIIEQEAVLWKRFIKALEKMAIYGHVASVVDSHTYQELGKKSLEDAEQSIEREIRYLTDLLNSCTNAEQGLGLILSKQQPLEDKFIQVLKSIGKHVVDVPGDGNCFFHAVAAQLKLINDGDSPFNHEQLRVIAADYVESHKSELRDFVDGKGIDGYIERISRQGEWADNVLIQALARAIGVNIEIIQNTHPESPIRIDTSSPNTIYLGHIAELHYVSLENSDALEVVEDHLDKEGAKDDISNLSNLRNDIKYKLLEEIEGRPVAIQNEPINLDEQKDDGKKGLLISISEDSSTIFYKVEDLDETIDFTNEGVRQKIVVLSKGKEVRYSKHSFSIKAKDIVSSVSTAVLLRDISARLNICCAPGILGH